METETVRSLYYNPDNDTLDVWLASPSQEAYSEPLTENLVRKHDSSGETIGFEILSLSRLDKEDMRRLPREAKKLLEDSISRLSIIKRSK